MSAACPFQTWRTRMRTHAPDSLCIQPSCCVLASQVDTFYPGSGPNGTTLASRAFKGVSVRAVHSACEVGPAGYCPQDREKTCTAPLPFSTYPISRADPSAGVVAGELSPGLLGTARAPRSVMSATELEWVVPPVAGSVDLIGLSGPEHLFTALVKDFQPLTTLGDRYSTAQVLTREQRLPVTSQKPLDAGPGGTRFQNYQVTDIYFRCPAQLVEVETVRGPFAEADA